MSNVSYPTVTTDINQSFFVEALGGSQNPVSYLDRFPEAIYTKALDSLLVKFLYALMGPTGVGQLRQEYLEARLIIEEAGLQTTDLDSLYANAFAFARAAYETYDLDASASLLPAAQRAQILAQDASFRNRAMDFLKGARGGTTLQGLTLVAKSGLNQPVELVENYRALYDHFSDNQLGLEQIGQTGSVYEITVVPRQDSPKNALQTLTISGEPQSGWFTLTYPAGQQWSSYPFQVVSYGSTGIISVPDSSRFPTGAFVTLTSLASTATATQQDPTQPGWNNAVLYAQSLGGEGGLVSLGQTMTGSEGTPITIPTSLLSTNHYICFVGVAQTTPLPFNASAADVENALSALPVLSNNVTCTGGPFPDQPINVEFINDLSDQAVQTLQFNLAPDHATGVLTTRGFGPMADVVGNTLDINANVVVDTAGTSSTGVVAISPADMSSLYAALDQTRPVTSLFTTVAGSPSTIQQSVSSSFTGSNQIEVLRYETGRAVPWPTLDSVHWIEAGVEHEAPTVYGVSTQYQGFHNISSAISYTEQALFDSGYPAGTIDPSKTYWDSLIGNYSTGQLQLYPGLAALNSGNAVNQFLPQDAEAPYAEPLIITTNNAVNVINQIYPVDYMSVQGVPQPAGGLLWASAERPAGTDYLEIDLGSVQAVNYLYFEATNKPYLIDIAYDVLDQSPVRNFNSVTITPASNGVTTLSLNYRATQLWATVTVNFNDSIGGMIYTRFLRIGFTKTPVGTVYQPIGQQTVPYSIEVRNLRLGRNVG